MAKHVSKQDIKTVDDMAQFLRQSDKSPEFWADRSGLSFFTIYRIRNGQTKNPSVDTFNALLGAIREEA